MSDFKTDQATFYHAAILTARIETNVPQGGDAGHGGKTTVVLKDEGSFAFGAVNVKGEHGQADAVEIHVRGDSEAEVLANALMWAGERLHALIGTSPGSNRGAGRVVLARLGTSSDPGLWLNLSRRVD